MSLAYLWKYHLSPAHIRALSSQDCPASFWVLHAIAPTIFRCFFCFLRRFPKFVLCFCLWDKSGFSYSESPLYYPVERQPLGGHLLQDPLQPHFQYQGSVDFQAGGRIRKPVKWAPYPPYGPREMTLCHIDSSLIPPRLRLHVHLLLAQAPEGCPGSALLIPQAGRFVHFVLLFAPERGPNSNFPGNKIGVLTTK